MLQQFLTKGARPVPSMCMGASTGLNNLTEHAGVLKARNDKLNILFPEIIQRLKLWHV